MKIIYSDENLERMNKAKEIADSTIFHDYINNNINQALKWEYGMFRVQSYELRKLIEAYYRRYNFIFGKDIKHDYGIGNNNQLFIKDLKSGEFVAGIYITKDMSGNAYFGITDIHEKVISSKYHVSRYGLSISR